MNVERDYHRVLFAEKTPEQQAEIAKKAEEARAFTKQLADEQDIRDAETARDKEKTKRINVIKRRIGWGLMVGPGIVAWGFVMVENPRAGLIIGAIAIFITGIRLI